MCDKIIKNNYGFESIMNNASIIGDVYSIIGKTFRILYLQGHESKGWPVWNSRQWVANNM